VNPSYPKSGQDANRRPVAIRPGDLCALPHRDAYGNGRIVFAFHVRAGTKVCESCAFLIDLDYAAPIWPAAIA
jgi:hypothetical protein